MVSKVKSEASYPKSVKVQDKGSVKGKLDLGDTVEVTFSDKSIRKMSLKDFVGGKIPGLGQFGRFSTSADRLAAAISKLAGKKGNRPDNMKNYADTSVEQYRTTPEVVKSDAISLRRGFNDKFHLTRFYAIQEYSKIVPNMDASEVKEGAAAVRGLFRDSDEDNRGAAVNLYRDLIPRLDTSAQNVEFQALVQLATEPTADSRVKELLEQMIAWLASVIARSY